jgi:hypothetical protein
MKSKFFLCVLVVFSVALPATKMAGAQSNIDSLWSLLKNSKPIQENSPVWENAGRKEINETCISGDCNNGYGISISTDRDLGGRYQYEGRFLDAKHDGYGTIKTEKGYIRVIYYNNGKEAGAYLLANNGLMELHNADGTGSKKERKEFGFALEVVQKHLSYSFEKFTACTCLGRGTHIVVEEYQQPYDLTDQLKNNRGTGYRTETRRVEYPGLKNNCKGPVYVKAISNEGGYYFDRSVVVLPGSTIKKRPFNASYTNTKEEVEYLGQYEGIKN